MAVFWMLCRDRPIHFGGPGSITMRSMIDYQELYSDPLNTEEIDVLLALDRSYLNAVHKAQEK